MQKKKPPALEDNWILAVVWWGHTVWELEEIQQSSVAAAAWGQGC